MTYLSRFGNMTVVDEPVYKSELFSGLGYMAGFYSQTADSTTITNTTTETTLARLGLAPTCRIGRLRPWATAGRTGSARCPTTRRHA